MIRSLDTLERETDRMILLRMDVSFIHGFVLRGVNWLHFEKKNERTRNYNTFWEQRRRNAK